MEFSIRGTCVHPRARVTVVRGWELILWITHGEAGRCPWGASLEVPGSSYRDDSGVWGWLVGLVGAGWRCLLCHQLLTEGSVRVTKAAAWGFYVTNNLRRRRQAIAGCNRILFRTGKENIFVSEL